MKIRYDITTASKVGVSEHPKKQIEKLGIKVLSYEGVPIADCVLMEVETNRTNFPDYITILD